MIKTGRQGESSGRKSDMRSKRTSTQVACELEVWWKVLSKLRIPRGKQWLFIGRENPISLVPNG
jgi:hypothetical protein